MMKTININQLHTLPQGLKVIPFEKRYCWYLCKVVAPSSQNIFKVDDIVAISIDELLKCDIYKEV